MLGSELGSSELASGNVVVITQCKTRRRSHAVSSCVRRFEFLAQRPSPSDFELLVRLAPRVAPGIKFELHSLFVLLSRLDATDRFYSQTDNNNSAPDLAPRASSVARATSGCLANNFRTATSVAGAASA